MPKKLKIKKILYRKNGKTGGLVKKYLCECECGNEKIVNAKNYNKGKIRSCGCLKKERYKSKIPKDPKQRLVERICLYPGYKSKKYELSKKTLETLKSIYHGLTLEMDEAKISRDLGNTG